MQTNKQSAHQVEPKNSRKRTIDQMTQDPPGLGLSQHHSQDIKSSSKRILRKVDQHDSRMVNLTKAKEKLGLVSAASSKQREPLKQIELQEFNSSRQNKVNRGAQKAEFGS